MKSLNLLSLILAVCFNNLSSASSHPRDLTASQGLSSTSMTSSQQCLRGGTCSIEDGNRIVLASERHPAIMGVRAAEVVSLHRDCIVEKFKTSNIECRPDEEVVCGCDGKQYNNVCTAMNHGLMYWTKGPC
jgi:hypothetical protein